MQYLHIKEVQKYHTLYKDRNISWIKAYYSMLTEPEYVNIVEIDKWRFIAFTMLEIRSRREVLINETYLTKMGFDFTQRSLDATLTSLSPLIDIVDSPSEEGKVLRRAIKPKTEKDILFEKECRELFNYWNSKKTMVHRDYGKYYPCIKGRLEKYKLDEIKVAIDNYALVLLSKDYYWSYKWSVEQFLVRKNGLDRFMKENFNEREYRVKDNVTSSIDRKIQEMENFEN